MKRPSECGNTREPCVQQVGRLLAWYSGIEWPTKYRICIHLMWCPWWDWMTESKLVAMVTVELVFWVTSQPGVEYGSGFRGYAGVRLVSDVTAWDWMLIWFPWLRWSWLVTSQPGIECGSGFHGYAGVRLVSDVTTWDWMRIWFPWLRWSWVG